jgi:hypothetical protein
MVLTARKDPIGKYTTQQDGHVSHRHRNGENTPGFCRDSVGVDGNGSGAAGSDGLVFDLDCGVYVSSAHAGYQVFELGHLGRS